MSNPKGQRPLVILRSTDQVCTMGDIINWVKESKQKNEDPKKQSERVHNEESSLKEICTSSRLDKEYDGWFVERDVNMISVRVSKFKIQVFPL
jgi:hypothetical protein